MEEVFAVIVATLVALGLWLAGGWFAMVCIGAAHASDGRVPALGFSVVLWLTLALGTVVGGSVKAGQK